MLKQRSQQVRLPITADSRDTGEISVFAWPDPTLKTQTIEGEPGTNPPLRSSNGQENVTKLLLEAQEYERRRLASALHNDALQLIVSARLNLARLKDLAPQDTQGLIAEQENLMADLLNQIRTLSFLGHPPALEGKSLSQAINSLLSGFAKRTNLTVASSISLRRPVSDELSACLYRIGQEALTNVFRHARATRVWVRLLSCREQAVLSVTDDGRNACPAAKWEMGVGLQSMIAQAASFGGRVSLRRSRASTTLLAVIPIGN
jgi:two-component system NarL family sensor kinase